MTAWNTAGVRGTAATWRQAHHSADEGLWLPIGCAKVGRQLFSMSSTAKQLHIMMSPLFIMFIPIEREKNPQTL